MNKRIFGIFIALFILSASSAYADVTGSVTVTWTNVIFTFYTGELCIEDTSIFGPFDSILVLYSKDDHITPPQPFENNFTQKTGNKWCSDLNGNLWDSSPTADTLANAKIYVRDNTNSSLFQDDSWTVNTSVNVNDSNHVFHGGDEVLSIDLYEGWNLVSLPFEPANNTLPAVLSSIEGNYTIVWAYKAVDTLDPWKSYSPSLPDIFNDLKTMEPWYGYWIKMTNNDTWVIG